MGQHYIPQYYLSGFAEEERLWVYDKNGSKPYKSQPKSIANENKIYSDTGESYLANKIESPVRHIIDKIKSLTILTDHERMLFSRYIALMWMRVPSGRELINKTLPHIGDQIIKSLHYHTNKLDADLEKELKEIISEPSSEIWQKLLQTNFHIPIVNDLVKMKWHYIHSKQDKFLTSDNPFFRISNGAGDKIIEISFPISSNVTLLGSTNHHDKDVIISAKHSLIRQINSRSSHNSTRYIYSKHHEDWILPFHLNRNKKIYLISEKKEVIYTKRTNEQIRNLLR